MPDRHVEPWSVDAANAAARRARPAATSAAVARARATATIRNPAPIVNRDTTDPPPAQDTAMPDLLDPIRRRLAARNRPRITESTGGGDTADHSPLMLPAGVCLWCGITCDTPVATRPLPGFTNGVSGSTCPTCHHADPAPADDPARFVAARVRATFPDLRAVLPGHLAARIDAGGPAAPVMAATWAAHARSSLVRGRPNLPPANRSRWGHLADPSR